LGFSQKFQLIQKTLFFGQGISPFLKNQNKKFKSSSTPKNSVFGTKLKILGMDRNILLPHLCPKNTVFGIKRRFLVKIFWGKERDLFHILK